jgi:threonine aldolase
MTTSIDLRSDTVTKPTLDMRVAMANAVVDDDVIGRDPTVQKLEERVAALLGKESAVFMPSGTMANQIALRVHCQPGDEFICDVNCHIYNHEQGGFAQLSGLVAKTVAGRNGVFDVPQLAALIRPANDHFVRTRLACVENTHNRGGGKIYPLETIRAVCGWAESNGIRRHMDGARLFNAVVATGIDATTWAEPFDTVSVCASKGLGAPVGSVLAGPSELMKLARRHRKLFGGGMRQSGVIAAGALFAFENHVARLAEDHAHAALLARGIREIPGLQLVDDGPETNILFFEVDREVATAADFAGRLRERGVLMLAESPTRIRAITHLNVSRAQIEQAIEILAEVVESFRKARQSHDRVVSVPSQ